MNGVVLLLTTAVSDEQDVFALRRYGRTIAETAGLDQQDQIRLATALSELGRDRLGCAGVTVRFVLGAEPAPTLEVTTRWVDGPAPAPEALSSVGRLVRDTSHEVGGRRGSATLRVPVPVAPAAFAEISERIGEVLHTSATASREEDLRAQTRDLVVALEEARFQGDELRLLNEELEQTNAGVMALYSELSTELEQTNTGVVALHAELEAKSRQLVPDGTVALLFPDPARLPTLVTDEAMLARVLRNLVGNSLKFTTTGYVRIRVGMPDAHDGTLEISVEDTGVGIPEQDLEKVFEEFYQVRGAHQRGRTGTGLGLPYARRLVELLGGTLTLTSTPARGTTATVTLPAAGAAAPAAPTRVSVVISADDDAAFSAAFRPLLAEIAERVVQVADGAALLEAVRRERPGAIVVDLDMPEIDGYEVLRRLAGAGELAAIPVVVVTGFPVEQTDRARLGHARAVLAKASVGVSDLAAALGLSRPGAGSA
ncbi:CheY-like chemotaxis protein/anti-sigma regulatory factor (Ser/Thr protein kinase) [Catenulispora sp. GP43]|uniref:ATP-binding protein n=1 Tax=Catenulispora sp. GP43 TaxID=3156263 RepID=UPI003518FB5E